MQRLGKLLRIPTVIALLVAIYLGWRFLSTLQTPASEMLLLALYTVGGIGLLFGILFGGGKLLGYLSHRNRPDA